MPMDNVSREKSFRNSRYSAFNSVNAVRSGVLPCSFLAMVINPRNLSLGDCATASSRVATFYCQDASHVPRLVRFIFWGRTKYFQRLPDGSQYSCPRGFSGLFSGVEQSTFSDCQTVVSAHAHGQCVQGKIISQFLVQRVQFRKCRTFRSFTLLLFGYGHQSAQPESW